jgi:hypothetical protein
LIVLGNVKGDAIPSKTLKYYIKESKRLKKRLINIRDDFKLVLGQLNQEVEEVDNAF